MVDRILLLNMPLMLVVNVLQNGNGWFMNECYTFMMLNTFFLNKQYEFCKLVLIITLPTIILKDTS